MPRNRTRALTRPAPAAARKMLADVMGGTVKGLTETTPLLRAALRGITTKAKDGTDTIIPENIDPLLKIHAALLRTVEVQTIAHAAARMETPQLRIVVPDRLAEPAEIIEVAAARAKRDGGG